VGRVQPAALDLGLVRSAFAMMSSPGRLEVVRRSPLVIIDAAHNPAGMAATVAALSEAFTFTELVAILAVSEDKDVPGILDELEPVASELVVTGNSSPRSADPGKLAEMAAAVFGPDRVRAVPRLDDAIEIGVALADEADARDAAGGLPGTAAVLIAGSVVTAGDARLLLTGSGPGERARAEDAP
jgi:dihydrofolate synthase/folylpolyglutamate synthase